MGEWWDSMIFPAIEGLLGRLAGGFSAIPDIVRNPSANPVEAVIVIGIAVVLVLIAAVTIAIFTIRVPSGAPALEQPMGEGVEWRSRARRKRTPWQRLSIVTSAISLLVVLVAAVGGLTHITTADSGGCKGCHLTSVHSSAPQADPHLSVACIDCHESPGLITRAVIGFPKRLQHYVTGATQPANAVGYGRPVSSVGCKGCHAASIDAVAVDATRGIKVSHVEPLAAGAECVDCHALRDGQVGAATAGMEPCLRCHDGKQASSDCSVCHIHDPAVAAAAQSSVTMVSKLVPNPSCTGCHPDMTRCDDCHGLRMPHTPEFMASGHARAGALSIWDADGRPCSTCHYRGRRACTQQGCHTHEFPQHALTWKADHQQASWSMGDSICRCHNWASRGREARDTFCVVCHPTRPSSAVP
jgi:hypothetical protein